MTAESSDTSAKPQNPDEYPLWPEEASRGIYTFPLAIDEATLADNERLVQAVAEDQRKKVGPFWTQLSPESHNGPFTSAIDILVSDGTPVLASQGGTIVDVAEVNTEWGPGPEFADKLNYVTIAHLNGEFTQYAHLAQGSVSGLNLAKGVRVEQGQQIAIVGKTGWTDRDHLHFLAFRLDSGTPEQPNPHGFRSLVPEFES